MEKISRILPPSNRLTAADTETSPALRPGAPAMGRRGGGEGRRAEAVSSNNTNREEDRMTLSQTALDRLKAAANNEEEEIVPGSAAKKNSESAKLKIVEDLNRKFFANLKKEILGREAAKSEQINEEMLSPL